MLIGGEAVFGLDTTLHALHAVTGERLPPQFGGGGAAEVDRACRLAATAIDSFRETTLAQRADFLEAIAQGLVDLGPALIERAVAESGLPQARLEGERARTVGQLKLFAQVVRDGRWLDVTIDPALPDRAPMPRPDRTRVSLVSIRHRRGPTCGCATSRSARSRCSAPATFRSRFPWRAATPPRPWPPAARWS